MKQQDVSHKERARKSFQDNDFNTAIEHYKKALSFEVDDEDYVILMTELAITFANTRQYCEAINALNSILHEACSGEQLFLIYSVLGECYFNLGEYSNALNYYQFAGNYCKTQKDQGEIKLGMGKSFFFLEQYKKAKESLEECKQFLNTFTSQLLFVFHYHAGMTDLYLHKYDSAKDHLEQLPKYQSNEIEEAMYYLALTAYYYVIKEFEKMHEYLEIASKYASNQQSQRHWLEYYKEKYLRHKKKLERRGFQSLKKMFRF